MLRLAPLLLCGCGFFLPVEPDPVPADDDGGGFEPTDAGAPGRSPTSR